MLVQLEARDFRNLEPLELELGVGTHLLLGPNGAGKTSFLEAIYLLATTRSFRTPRVGDCCRHGGQRFRISGEVEASTRIQLGFTWEKGNRERTLNSRKAPLAEHLAALPVVAWTASDVEILIGSPEERRRFLDRGVVGRRPSALDVLFRYRRALREKRLLLQRGNVSAAEMDSWNWVLAEAAAEVRGLRSSYADRLRRTLEEVLEACRLGIPTVDLLYRPSPDIESTEVEPLYEELCRIAPRERHLERPLMGPHRDDLRILWSGHELKRVASAGERKALGLALMTAHGEVLRREGRKPLYLLDDVDTELDRPRLEALWTVLKATDQLFASSNRPWVLESLEVAQRWHCQDGRIVPQ